MSVSEDVTPGLLPELTAADRAPEPRTLCDILAATMAEHPDEPAIDAGNGTLTYAELQDAVQDVADRLAESGIGPGDKVGVRISSGTLELYVAILGIIMAGAAYVPVDADDPDERARVVFEEAGAAAVIGADLAIVERAEPGGRDGLPGIDDDAWVIFTSGSTGKPKGVAVSHRSAAAFVDAETALFVPSAPIGPGDRVMAGLSVAFDASCEEMWLAWAHGACLVPAPRSLVRSGTDIAPWLVANEVSIVSTVPTLVSLWPASALDAVRLLILGGEACPPELAERLATSRREVWNTYGPTEATVVSCAARLTGEVPVRIGLPLSGWDLAVVDEAENPVPVGASGQLIIGGVGLARYLDPVKDAEKYAPMPSLGWDRAYRSGDVVVNDPAGLLFAGRADDQIKIGGRRIELGEIDDQLLRLPGVASAAAAVRRTKAGNQLLVGYVTAGPGFDADAAAEQLRAQMPAAMVPRIAVVEAVPTKTSGKVDRDALPWPVPSAGRPRSGALDPTQSWLAEIWSDVLGAEVDSPDDDFFTFGGGSLTAAQVVGRIRERHAEVAVGDVYAHPKLGQLAALLDTLGTGPVRSDRRVAPIPAKTQLGQLAALLPLRMLAAFRWLAWLMLGSTLARDLTGLTALPRFPGWVLVVTTVVFLLPPGRMALAALLARIVLRPVTPGVHPRGGRIHLRVWLADRIQDELVATGLAGAPWFTWYARRLGARIGRGVDLHTIPPVTGFLEIGKNASVEPEVDLSGTWIDGDRFLVGSARIGARARVGTRSMLGPDASVGAGAEIAPGSYVTGSVGDDEYWSGAPAGRHGPARGPAASTAPPRGRGWELGYGLLGALIAALPGISILAVALVFWSLSGLDRHSDAGHLLAVVLLWLPVLTVAGYLLLALLIWTLVRVLAPAVRPGVHPVRSGRGLAVWCTVHVLDDARRWLFPLYSSSLTPQWLRLLGARIGRDVEASTVLMIPALTQVGAGAFLADDTLIGGYELGGGWLRVERVKVGKRAFVGNSGMAAPGRKVPRASLVAVLSAAPRRGTAKAGTSWLGSPPAKLRRAAGDSDESLTYQPGRRVKVLRALVELARVVPMIIAIALDVVVAAVLLTLLDFHPWLAWLLGGAVLIAGGLAAAVITALAKWLLIGRVRAGQHPLWSAFVWRNELSDTFVEVLAAPWFAGPAQGTAALNVWLRVLGARIGRGVWCDSYWLPEVDLVRLGDGATVNHGCVVQTHLFHDRVLALDEVVIGSGATLGPNSVILPAASIGRHTTVGPVSLVMRGEAVPSRTRWLGNPIGPWEDDVA